MSHGTLHSAIAPVSVPPMDEYNQTLVDNLHPSDWVNPEPAPRYNLVVIGAGTAGLVTAAGAGLLGAKVALIERHLMGGDCTIVGCVPSKAMIRSGRAAAHAREAERFGVDVSGITVDFPEVMERLRRVRAEISPNDSAKRFRDEFGVDVFLGDARFSSSNTIEVADKTLRFRKAAIATGSHPVQPAIEGLEAAGYLTNETVFTLTKRPDRLAVIGGGYIGCELGQTFQRLGSAVVLLHKGARILEREDVDAAKLMQNVLIQEGVRLVLDAKVVRVERRDSVKIVHYDVNGQENSVTVDEILVTVGRSPRLEGLNLDAVGVQYDSKKGVIVNDYLQSTNPNIYAAGDVCMAWKFTHAANAAARIVVQNALFSVFGIGRKRLSSLVMPWCTYTDPEIAHVGMYPEEAQQRGIETHTLYVPLDDIDRALIDGETDGFAKVYVKTGTDQILGATIVARHAGEMISEFTLAIVGKLGLKAIANTIHPYPTQAEVIRRAADAYSLSRLDSFKKLSSTWLAWRR